MCCKLALFWLNHWTGVHTPSVGMYLAKAMALRQHQRTMRLLAISQAIWGMITPAHDQMTERAHDRMTVPAHDNCSSLLALPPEILQYIRDLLPLNSAACFIISNKNLLRILGSKTLHSLKEKDHAWERKLFLMTLEKELPDWQLCHPCSRFHPIDRKSTPESVGSSSTPKCVQINGRVKMDIFFRVRFQHVQLIMNRYRFGLPYVNDLKRLNYHYQVSIPDSCAESTVTAFIENSKLFMRVTSRLRLPDGWNRSLIPRRLPHVCRHNEARPISSDQTLLKTLLCRRSHGDRRPCAECRDWKRCRFCPTYFLVTVLESKDAGTSIVVEVQRRLGSRRDPFDPDWREHIDKRW